MTENLLGSIPRRVLGLLALGALGAVIGSFTLHNYPSGFFVGLGLGLLWFGFPENVRMDSTMTYRIWGHPTWLRWVAAALMVFGALGLPSTLGAGVQHYVVMVLVITGAVWLTLGNWLMERFGYARTKAPAGPDDEDAAALRRWSSDVLLNAGLTVRSQYSGNQRTPDVVATGRDAVGHAYAEVAVIPGAQTPDLFVKRAANIASAWGVPRVEVREVDEARHVVRLTAWMKELSADGPVVWEPIDTSQHIVDYIKALPMGRFVDGRPAHDAAPDEVPDFEWHLDLTARNFVIGGMPGSGKSSFINSLVAHLVRHPDVRTFYIDLKDGVEAAQWDGALSGTLGNTAALGNGADDTDAALLDATLAFLKDVRADMSARYQRMQAAGVTDAYRERFLGPDEPLKVVIVDECADLFRSDTREMTQRSAEVQSQITQIIRKGRAAGYILLFATQRPTVDSLPGPIRSNASDKVAFHVADMVSTYAVLGDTYPTNPRDPMTDPTRITAPGQANIVSAPYTARRVQCQWLSKEAKAGVRAEAVPRPFFDQAPVPEPEPVAAPVPAPVAPTAPLPVTAPVAPTAPLPVTAPTADYAALPPVPPPPAAPAQVDLSALTPEQLSALAALAAQQQAAPPEPPAPPEPTGPDPRNPWENLG